MRDRSFLSIQTSFLALILIVGCGDSGGDGGPDLDELYAQGLTRFVDAFDPANSPEPDENGIKRFVFEVPEDLSAEPRGPLCLRGAQYAVDTRTGVSEELLIFLQGGGACWPDFCSAFETSDRTLGEVAGGILNPELAENPLADHDVVYLPYCDGALFAGDIDRLLPPSAAEGDFGDDLIMSYQRGLQNLTAALDIAVAEFPNPSRVVIAGISGGGFGTITATPLARFYYPDVDILVLNDSGIGVAKPSDVGFVSDLLEGWNAAGLIPASCIDCTSNGHITRLIEWNLAADPQLWMSAISHAQDSVIADFFLMISASEFQTSLLSETERIAADYPDRYRRFIMPGEFHTALLNAGEPIDIELAKLGSLQTEIDGISLWEWVTGMIDGTDDWKNLVDDSL